MGKDDYEDGYEDDYEDGGGDDHGHSHADDENYATNRRQTSKKFRCPTGPNFEPLTSSFESFGRTG